jgi:hypothetical protein
MGKKIILTLLAALIALVIFTNARAEAAWECYGPAFRDGQQTFTLYIDRATLKQTDEGTVTIWAMHRYTDYGVRLHSLPKGTSYIYLLIELKCSESEYRVIREEVYNSDEEPISFYVGTPEFSPIQSGKVNSVYHRIVCGLSI